MKNFRTRPHFEDRQIVQYNDESVRLSGMTKIAATVLDFTGTTTAQTAVTIMGVTGYLNSGRDYGLVVEPPLLRVSGTTGYTSVDVTGYVLKSLDSGGTVTWAPVSVSADTNTFVTGGTLTGTDLVLGWNTGGSATPIDLSALSGETTPYTFSTGGTNNIITVFGNNNITTVTNTPKNSSILGGENNTINGWYSSAIVAGTNNTISNNSVGYVGHFIGAGNSNTIDSIYGTSTIVGGVGNTIGSLDITSSIVGGSSNYLMGSSSFIGAGLSNTITGQAARASIVGGYNNKILGQLNTFIGGGGDNTIGYQSYHSIIGGGNVNYMSGGTANGIFGGQNNTIQNSDEAAIFNGKNCTIYGTTIKGSHKSIIGGGYNNYIRGQYNTILGGSQNDVDGGDHTSVVGGAGNDVKEASYSFIGGGGANYINGGSYHFIGGGKDNQVINNSYGVITGGYGNTLDGIFSTVVGGYKNVITGGTHSSIIGGQNNILTHNNSHIIGSNLNSISENTTHVDGLNINTVETGTSISFLAISSDGTVIKGSDLYGEVCSFCSSEVSGDTIVCTGATEISTINADTGEIGCTSTYSCTQWCAYEANGTLVNTTTDYETATKYKLSGYITKCCDSNSGDGGTNYGPSITGVTTTPGGGPPTVITGLTRPFTVKQVKKIAFLNTHNSDIVNSNQAAISNSTLGRIELSTLSSIDSSFNSEIYGSNLSSILSSENGFITNSSNSTIISSQYSTLNGVTGSTIIGGNNITGTDNDTVYVSKLNIDTLGGGTSINNLGIDVNGNVVVGTAGGGGAPEATTATTTTINFTGQTIYYNAGSPGTGNISEDLTGAKLGLIQKIYHNDGTEPTYPAGWVLMGDAIYFTSTLNIIYAEWAGGSRVEYWYVQEQ